jgi:glucose-6-phosphate 1-epimerase
MPQPNETLAALNTQHAIPGIAQITEPYPGMPAARITTNSCAATMHIHGAHVTSWRPAGSDEIIFVSSKARYVDGQAIRGGIPICFPWFRGKSDDPKAPAHGFVRTKSWNLQSIKTQGADVAVTMSTSSDAATKKWWPHEFRAELRVTFGRNLKLEFSVENAGTNECHYEEALHTYYLVGDIASARVQGLDGASYLDNTDGNREKKQLGEVSVGKTTDNAYVNNESALGVMDPVLKRRMHIRKENSRTAVIWNPWKEAAEKMSDMGADEWKKMLCVEGANILGNAIKLIAGENHTTTVTMSVQKI